MFNSIAESGSQELLQTRLSQAEQELRSIPVTTRQEVLAEIYSRLNQALSLGNRVSPLRPVVKEGPALASDLGDNLRILNLDAQSIVRQLLNTENDAATLFNLFAATQNSLRQLVREQIFLSTQRQYIEQFIFDRALDANTGTIDFNAGLASLPVVAETSIKPASIVIGVGSQGGMAAGSTTDLLLDGLTETSMTWNGGRLELIFEFDQPRILNRCRVELLGYQGLSVEEFSSSPDGVLREDLLAEQVGDSRSMDGSSSKFSGDWIADFDPRHVKQLRLILADRVGGDGIVLRNVYFSQRRFGTSATVQTKQIDVPAGALVFHSQEHGADLLTSITHQVSTDGSHFQAIASGQQVDVGGGPFWYRGVLERLDSNFDQASNPVETRSDDPGLSDTYRLTTTSSVDLGGGIIERSLSFEDIHDAVLLRETPLDGTLVVYNGPMTLPASAYSFTNNRLVFAEAQVGITVRYQTSAYGRAGLLARKDYYSPYLYEVRFEKL